MTTKKILSLAALALTLAACSNEDDALTQQTDGQPADNMITITAQLAPKDGGAQTRAVADKGDNKITVDWAVNEHLAILYEVNSTKYLADATITAVDGSGTATIEFDINGSTPANTDCTIVYPLSAAKDDKSGVKDYATLLAAQDGTLNANLDVRVGAGKIVPGLNVTTQPAAQFAIFKLAMKDIDGTADVSATSVAISDQTGATLTTVTPASGYDKQMYVALPITPTTLKFSVTGSDSKKYFISAQRADSIFHLDNATLRAHWDAFAPVYYGTDSREVLDAEVKKLQPYIAAKLAFVISKLSSGKHAFSGPLLQLFDKNLPKE